MVINVIIILMKSINIKKENWYSRNNKLILNKDMKNSSKIISIKKREFHFENKKGLNKK